MTTPSAVFAVVTLLAGLPGPVPAAAPTANPGTAASGTAAATDGEALLERLKALTGEWRAPEGKSEMVNLFRPIAFGTAVLHEEWKDGQQLTATVFYLVDGELRADHFSDFQNQLHFAVHATADGQGAEFVLRDASNLDTHPRHFHSSTWIFRDATHLFQEWHIAEPGKDGKAVRLDFTKRPA